MEFEERYFREELDYLRQLSKLLATKLATNETETCCHSMIQNGIWQESSEANMA